MDCTHELVTALEANVIGVGYMALCKNCGNRVFISTARKDMEERRINKLIKNGYTKETARQMVAAQMATEDDEIRIASENAAQKAEEERRRK